MNTQFLENLYPFYSELDGQSWQIRPHGEGLINTSWCIFSPKKVYFLQKVNTSIFKNISALEHNISEAEAILNGQGIAIFPIKNKNRQLHTHIGDSVFRLFPFISNANTYQSPPDNHSIFSMAKIMAEFSDKLTPYASDFVETIPNFHNLSVRFDEFSENFSSADPVRLAKTHDLQATIEKYVWIVDVFKQNISQIPQRVFHHDAKINNILFEPHSSDVRAIVDLDTIMPGYIVSDFGDMVWSAVLQINHNKLEPIVLDEDKYYSLSRWYLSGFSSPISEIEEKMMHFGALVMSYMLAIRFFNDYLHGDKYFKILYPEHNLERAQYQMQAVEAIFHFHKKYNLGYTS